MNATSDETLKLMNYVHDNIIGREFVFSSPFGLRKVLYCDYVASSKPLECIEDFIRDHVMPTYGNTHTTTSVTAIQTTLFRQEARDIIRNAVRASEHDAVIFTGSGVTGAVHKLINALNLTKPPVVFCGPHEHHSNLLPWRECAAHVIRISETENGNVNIDHLLAALNQWKDSGLPMVGCFSAASNVTGQLADTVTISSLLHRFNAMALWDYATAAPYVEIDMHPTVADGDASKDAIFISPHKFIGGVSTPGVLVAGKHLFRNPVPSSHGGGSVFFVSKDDHKYLKDHEMREEGGTPDIIGAIRAGLCFKLKEEIGSRAIMDHETLVYKRATEAWTKVPNLEILGLHDESVSDSKLAIFSFMIRHPESGLYLHYSFVAAVLNDLLGIQARGGCACAGPYAQDLLGISPENVEKFQRALVEDSRLDRRHLRRFKEYSAHEVLRPGFVRLSIPYFLSDEETDFIIEAVKMIAEYAWMILPKYMFDPETGEWKHINQKIFKDRKWLGSAKFTPSGITIRDSKLDASKGNLPPDFQSCLATASEIFKNLLKSPGPFLPDHDAIFDQSVDDLRWFLTPSEAQTWLSKLQGQKLLEPTRRKPSFAVRKTVKQYSKEEIAESVSIPETVKELILSLGAKQPETKNANTSFSRSFVGAVHQGNGQLGDIDAKAAVRVQSDKIKKSTNGIHPVNQLNDDEQKSCPVSKNTHHSPKAVVKFISPSKRLFKSTVQAIDEFEMIRNGDRVLVCLSGGKDSLSLLHTLRQYQFYAKKQNVDFELGAVTVDPKTSSYDPSPLISYLAALGLTYFFEEQSILDQALALPEVTSICAFCSRMKRGRLYHCARREGWNVLAMGQHLDDLAESFLMSVFQNGLLRTMKANYTVKEGDLRVIRPFVYVREKETREFAENSHLPVIPENCPACFEAPKERHRMKQLLASQEIVHSKLFYSVKEALRPLMAKNQTGIESGGFVINSDTVQFDED